MRETLAIWLLDPLLALASWAHEQWGVRVALPLGTQIARHSTRLALRVAPEVVLAETASTAQAWMALSNTLPRLAAVGASSSFDTAPTLPVLPVLPVLPDPQPMSAMTCDVPTLSAVAVALERDPDPVLVNWLSLSRALANAMREMEARQIGWPDRLSSDLATAVLCLPRRIDERLQQMLEEAGKSAPSSYVEQPPTTDGAA